MTRSSRNGKGKGGEREGGKGRESGKGKGKWVFQSQTELHQPNLGALDLLKTVNKFLRTSWLFSSWAVVLSFHPTDETIRKGERGKGRLSPIKKCPHMLKLDHWELRNSKGHKMGLRAHCRVLLRKLTSDLDS